MNMQAIMAQAQRMQKDIQKKKDEVSKQTFTSKTELVEVTFNGDKKMVSIKFNDSITLDKDDIEALEDMIKIATNDCIKQIDDAMSKALGPYSSQLNGLF